MPDPFPGPLSPEVRENPYPCFRWMQSERPVYYTPQGRYWALSRYADVMAAARNYSAFSSAQGTGLARTKGRTIISNDPPDHTRLRKLVNHAFQAGAVEALAPRMAQICHELIDSSAAARGSFDLIQDFAVPLPLMVIAELLGFDPARYDDYQKWSNTVSEFFSNPGSPDALRQYRQDAPAFFSYLREVAEARRHAPRGDLISLMIQAREERDALTVNEIASTCEFFLAAGNETTTGLIGNAALALAANPSEAAQVVKNPALIPSLIEETARFDTPFQADFRTTTTAVTLHGVEIPIGAKVALLWAAANRDPEVFADPDRFMVTRSPNPHLGFGHGIHYCIGAPLARLEARVAATVLLERFSHLAPDPNSPAVRRSTTPLLRGLRSLPMCFEIR